LVHVLDASGSEGRDPIEDFYAINEELFNYNEKLKDKPQIIVANKMDIMEGEENIAKIKQEFEPQGIKVYPLSAVTNEGIDELKYGIWNLLQTIEIDYETFDEEYQEEAIKETEDSIIVRKENDKYIVEGSFIERLIYSTYFDDVDSLRFFQDNLRKKGVIDKLKELGIDEGESVFICGYEFEFFE
jgi:GTP-binding protein